MQDEDGNDVVASCSRRPRQLLARATLRPDRRDLFDRPVRRGIPEKSATWTRRRGSRIRGCGHGEARKTLRAAEPSDPRPNSCSSSRAHHARARSGIVDPARTPEEASRGRRKSAREDPCPHDHRRPRGHRRGDAARGGDRIEGRAINGAPESARSPTTARRGNRRRGVIARVRPSTGPHRRVAVERKATSSADRRRRQRRPCVKEADTPSRWDHRHRGLEGGRGR